MRRSQEKVRNLFPALGGGGGGGAAGRRGVVVVIAVAFLIWIASGIYRVQPEEQGVVLRFGRLQDVTGPGLHIHWPWPFETVEKPQVTRVNRVEIGFRSGQQQGARTIGARDVDDEALMLTGDENIIDTNFVVLWKIGDPAQYLFNVRDPEATVKAAAESVVRGIVGQTTIVEATTEGRRTVETSAREQLQQLMVDYGAGILIDEVQLQKADPPQQVIDAFRDVQRAQADRERAQNEAEAYANDIIPRARGQAERLLQEAEAYRQETVARASGESERFKSVLAAYNTSRDVTERRIYLETMEQILRSANKIVLDGQNGVVPYLPLPQLQGPQAPTPGSGGAPQ